jgi:hypothetical protein
LGVSSLAQQRPEASEPVMSAVPQVKTPSVAGLAAEAEVAVDRPGAPPQLAAAKPGVG